MRRLMLLLLYCPVAVMAQTPPAPSDVVSLDASASTEIAYDQASATLVYDEQGITPAPLIDNASRAIDAALAQAKSVKEVRAHTGQFSTYPVYGKAQQLVSWRVRAELVLDSSDFKALSALTGQLSARLAVAGVNYSLSTASRKATENKLIAEAIGAYREKAQAAAQAFGYARYHVREVNVGGSGNAQPFAMKAQRFAGAAMADAAPLPIEAGRTTVTVTVQGSVQMEK